MKLIIAGGRHYKFTPADIAKLDSIPGVKEVVSGCCSGADEEGERWAHSKKLPVKKFVASWAKYGPASGPIRNKEMAGYADAVALFKGGKGTDSMWREADRAGILIYDFR